MMDLRPYQVECVDGVYNAFAKYDSALVVMATGLGKTVVFSRIAKLWGDWAGDRLGKRIMIVAHRDELIRQASGKLTDEGLRVEVEMAAEYANPQGESTVVTSVQTMCRPKRLQRFDPSRFGLCIIDEAHHAPARTYREILNYYQAGGLKILGVTATPKRADGLAMRQVFEEVAYEYEIAPAIADGWLVPIRQRVVTVDGLDFSKVRTLAGEFNQGDLEKVVEEESVLHEMAAPIAQESGGQQTLVFCVSVNQSKAIATILDRYRSGSAAFVCGETPREERQATVERYKRGEIQFLVNCGVFLEGFDAPNTRIVAMCRPTKSLALYAQMLGRVTRTLPGTIDGITSLVERKQRIAVSPKPWGTVLDFVGNCEKHNVGLVTSVDILGGKYSELLRRAATQHMQESAKPIDTELALEIAEAEHLLMQEQDAWRKRVVAKADYRTRETVLGAPGIERGARIPQGARREQAPGEPATDKQVGLLCRRFGWEWDKARALTKKQASGIIGRLMNGVAG